MDVVIPQLSENISSGTVVSIAVKPQDKVKKGQTLLELETEKAVLEIPCPIDGTIAEIMIKNGDLVQVGQAAFKLSTPEEAPPAEPETQKPEPEAATPSKTTEQPLPAPSSDDPEKPKTSKEEPQEPQGPKADPPVPPAPPSPALETTHDVPAAPSVRRLARELGLDVSQVSGTGDNGRISTEDVKAHAKKLLTKTGPTAGSDVPTPQLPDFSQWGEISAEPLSSVRRKIAQSMTYAWTTIPHVTHFAKADITELEKLRQKVSRSDNKLTITPFVIKVVATALKSFPKLNASIDMSTHQVIYKKYVNIGAAVDTEHGLYVPVIKNADQKSIQDLSQELTALAQKARDRKLSLEDMRGGTFTVTNLGGITGGTFTPIINAPEAAILGIARAELEPCYNDDAVCAPSLMLPLSLSYDHRLIDGADAARFIKWITDAIKQPFLLQLN